MKILILQDYLRSGGTERQSVLLANAFAAAGHATTLLTFRPGGVLAARPELVEGQATSPPLRVVRQVLQPFDTKMDWFAPRLGRTVSRIAPDIMLCMGRMANCYAGGLQKHLPRTTVIATMRTGKRLPLLYRRSLRLVRHIVANSHDAARVLAAAYAAPPEKISVIHNSLVFPPDADGDATLPSRSESGIGVPPMSGQFSASAPVDTPSAPTSATPHFNSSGLPTFRPSDSVALRAHHGATPTTTVLLCVAMFRPEKNHRFLVELAARLPHGADWQLWLAGEGETRPACAALAARLGVADRVKLLGFTADPAPLYRTADLGVLASQSESLPNFLIEAQAHGLPVVACDVGGVRECFLPGETGWAVPPDDPAAFLAALTPLLTDPARRKEIAPRSRAFARESFSPAHQTQRYLDLFARLAQ